MNKDFWKIDEECKEKDIFQAVCVALLAFGFVMGVILGIKIF